MKQELDLRTLQLVSIDSIEQSGFISTVDLSIEGDESFILSNGIISHNSARKSIHEARGKNPYIGSFALKGKPLNVMDVDMKKIIGGKDKDDDGNNEIKNILKITGLKLGVPVQVDPDKEWIEVEIDGILQILNIADRVFLNGKWVEVKELL